jgi:hypothetical protein
VDADFVQKYINNPRNALNLQNDAHDSMDKRMAWGIEAIFSDRVSFFNSVVIWDSHVG